MFIEKFQKGWNELDSEIIKTSKCTYCGACGAFCANIKYDQEREIPLEDGSCKDINTCRDGFGVCYNLCPKTNVQQLPVCLLDKWTFGKSHDKILGHYKKIISVKITDVAREKIPPEAGLITTLLYIAMEEGLIDAAIVTDKDENFRPFPMIAESHKGLFKAIGYKPSQSPTLSKIGEAINKEYADIAVVGTPCQIHALRKIQNHPRFDFEAYDLVSLAIGTFCFGTFHNKQLNECFRENGINSREILKIKTDNENFKMIITTKSGKKTISINYLYDKAIRNACFSCSDYTSEFADISVGNVGSEDGYRTVIVRTKKGKKLINLAIEKKMLELKPLTKDNEELVLEITKCKTDIVKIERIIEHSSEIKSIIIRNERIARAYRPGMFVVLWVLNYDFLPMSISNIDDNLIEITIQKIGEGTTRLFDLKEGDSIGIRGPFGNSWNYEDASNILIVGGGMGIAALTSLIEPLKQNKKNMIVTIGAKDEPSLIFADRLVDLIPNTLCSTDDGSKGKKCFVTDTIEDILAENPIDLIITCGPEVMMKKVLEIAEPKNIEVQASLERKMKCGVGLCGSCSIGEKNDITVCKEGPIFNSLQLKEIPQFGKYTK
ncbi:MAG: dihydroorotate dehydrogenase electron transfer subunit [Promethearchaeota archaeon]